VSSGPATKALANVPATDVNTEEPAPARPESVNHIDKRDGLMQFSSTILDHDIDPTTIIDVFQLHGKKVLVKFTSAAAKLKMIAARKSLPRDFKKNFINDQMTQVGGDLCKKCRKVRNEGGFKFVWTRLGKIFVKVLENSKTIEVQSQEDLDKLING
jgi:hypothetical protein